MKKPIHELTVDGQFPVELHQQKQGRYTVRYGGHVRRNMDYTNAAHEFGECALHALACAGMLDEKDASL